MLRLPLRLSLFVSPSPSPSFTVFSIGQLRVHASADGAQAIDAAIYQPERKERARRFWLGERARDRCMAVKNKGNSKAKRERLLAIGDGLHFN